MALTTSLSPCSCSWQLYNRYLWQGLHGSRAALQIRVQHADMVPAPPSTLQLISTRPYAQHLTSSAVGLRQHRRCLAGRRQLQPRPNSRRPPAAISTCSTASIRQHELQCSAASPPKQPRNNGPGPPHRPGPGPGEWAATHHPQDTWRPPQGCCRLWRCTRTHAAPNSAQV